jgi:hypothetical protein
MSPLACGDEGLIQFRRLDGVDLLANIANEFVAIGQTKPLWVWCAPPNATSCPPPTVERMEEEWWRGGV